MAILDRKRVPAGRGGDSPALKPWVIVIVLFGLFFFLLTAASAAPPLPDSIRHEYVKYFPSSACASCHVKIADQHGASSHARSFSDPLFQAQYFRELLPAAEKDESLYQEAKTCIACHSPIDYLVLNGRVFSAEQFNPDWSGVDCAFCHTIEGYSGERPGNGNYISKPRDERVYGPFEEKSAWHHNYSELYRKSEFCAICHNAVNRFGLEIKSTFTEWKKSIYAEKGIQCQDCHMNVLGFLSDGKAIYERGCAANPSDLITRAPDRPRLYSHRFPGAHSKTQISGAGNLSVHIETKRRSASVGEEITLAVFIDNSKTGHMMPTGSADLRLLWLQVDAEVDGRSIPLPATAGEAGGYAVNRSGDPYSGRLPSEIPGGVRVYHAVYVDKTGRPTLSSYNAVGIVFDNRLKACEVRRETYLFKVPQKAAGQVVFRASLNYLPYPEGFAERFGLPTPLSWEITSSTRSLPIR